MQGELDMAGINFAKLSPQLFGAFKTEGGGHKRPQDIKFWMGWDSEFDDGRGKQEWAGVQPSTYKMLTPNKEAYHLALQKMPNTLIVLRSWHYDDLNGERWAELMNNPVAAGEAIIDRWLAETDDWGIDYTRTCFMLWNEPHEWEGDAAKKNLTTATLAAMRRRKARRPQMSLLLLNLGVGWPGNHDTATVKDTPPDWSPYEPVHQEMLIDKIDILGMHEYWTKEGPKANFGWLAGRISKCPWNVPIIIGEAAYSGAVFKPQGSVPTELQGWAVSGMTAEKYMQQLIEYNEMCRADPRIIGWQVYLVDMANREWNAKDIEPMYGLLRNNIDKFKTRKQTFAWSGTPATPPVVQPPAPPPVVVPPEVTPVKTLTGKVVSRKSNEGTTSVYGKAPNGATVYFAWRGNDAIDGIQAGPHQGYENWHKGYFSIPLFRNGKTPTDGQWDIWVKDGEVTSPRVEFSTDGKGGKYNEIEVNFTETTVKPPVVEPPVVTPPTKPPVTEPKVMGWPLDKLVETQWWSRTHGGIDYSCAEGTPVKACADGTVVWVDDDRDTNKTTGGYGLYIRVWHPQLQLFTFYAHLSRQNVKQGDQVKKGQVIGLSGNTGNSTGPHLHFEIRLADENGKYDKDAAGDTYNARIDPMAFFAGLKRA